MTTFFGPLDTERRISPRQQTRTASFLISAHSALARQSALTLSPGLRTAWQIEMNVRIHREIEIVSLLLGATSWVPDLALSYMMPCWELAWRPLPVEGIPDAHLAMATSITTLAHAVHARIRPAALLPAEVNASDPFVMALRRIEFENGRLLQAQILFLKSSDLAPFRSVVSSALEQRHADVQNLWTEALAGVGIEISSLSYKKP